MIGAASAGARPLLPASPSPRRRCPKADDETLTVRSSIPRLMTRPLCEPAEPEDAEKTVRFAVETYGALHYAVNNAGIGGRQATHRAGGPRGLGPGHRLQAQRRALRDALPDPAMLEVGAAESAIVKYGVHPRRRRHQRLHNPQLRRRATHGERRGGVRAAAVPRQRRSGVHRDAAPRRPPAGVPRGAGLPASPGPARASRGGRPARVLPALGRASFITGGYYLIDGGYTSV